jgi:hypothetical protein
MGSVPNKQGDSEASAMASELADLAMQVIPICIEFDVPFSWTRGQVFDEFRPWNVIITGAGKCT